MLRLLTISLAAVSVSSCPRGATESPDLSAQNLEWTMLEHFDHVAAIRDAVVVGELETVAERAEVLVAETRPDQYPSVWRPHVETLLHEARTVATSATVASAASGAARLANACGACHVATEAEVEFGDVQLPPEDETVQAAMARHRWAVERLWEGIIGPSDYAWDQGAMVFVGTPGCGELFENSLDKPGRRQLCETVDRLGRRAHGLTDRAARVAVYGDFLATCSGCHEGS